MRLGVVFHPNANARYRAIHPMEAMERRGHTVVWPEPDGQAELRRLTSCDVIHVYRRASAETQKALAQLTRGGVPFTYDNDDDFTTIPKESPHYPKVGGAAGRRVFAEMMKVARQAQVVTTTNDLLAETYRREGAERVEVIGNFLGPGVSRRGGRHDGLVIGWVAGFEHKADADRIGIAQALRRLTAEHDHVQVECIGVDLELPERYRHDHWVDFDALPRRIAGFDIGLAPLADIPFNRTRSEIKLKEYAASGVPWLASPAGPYAGLGEDQGGRLVADDGWYEALERLVTRPRERKRLARKAKRWARGQTIEASAERWERVFTDAAAQASRI